MANRRNATSGCPYERIALVLQGGGALGTYQVGVYQALHEAGFAPDWVAGTSIGAINAAIIAGNAPDERLAKLDEFWSRIATPAPLSPSPGNGEIAKWMSVIGSMQAATFGQSGFFKPRPVNPWFAPAGSADAVSYYDTEELRATLEDVVDFRRINRKEVRLSLGAVHVTNGRQVYFDNKNSHDPITSAHVMASGALPPGFPPVEIDGELYWDGGIFSNTPLDVVLDDKPRVDTLCFIADLFDPVGNPPQTMDEVMERQKDIIYASRSHRHIDGYRDMHNLRRAVSAFWSELPESVRADREMQRLRALGCTTTMSIVHLIYKGHAGLTAAKDYDFSQASLARHREAGYRDATAQLARRPWAQPAPPHVGVLVHELPEAAE
ncbi:MAG: patatin-like phospholipase family protein [Alphaproteobacteria bacterium]